MKSFGFRNEMCYRFHTGVSADDITERSGHGNRNVLLSESEMKAAILIVIATIIATPFFTAMSFIATKLLLGHPIHW